MLELFVDGILFARRTIYDGVMIDIKAADHSLCHVAPALDLAAHRRLGPAEMQELTRELAILGGQLWLLIKLAALLVVSRAGSQPLLAATSGRPSRPCSQVQLRLFLLRLLCALASVCAKLTALDKRRQLCMLKTDQCDHATAMGRALESESLSLSPTHGIE